MDSEVLDPKKTNITKLGGISAKRAVLYNNLGVENIWDLITFFPRGYVDYSRAMKISEAFTDDSAEIKAIKAVVVKKLSPRFGDRASLYRVIVSDGFDNAICVFFNTEYTFSQLTEGEEYIFCGKIALTPYGAEINSPKFISSRDENPLRPVYRLTAGLSQAVITGNVRKALGFLQKNNAEISDFLNSKTLEEYNLIKKEIALTQIHFPKNACELEAAKRRLAFEELLVLQLGMYILKNRNRHKTGAVMTRFDISEFYSRLPFNPTEAQKRSVEECVQDMLKLVPMNRLLQGDVGSGKTLVAAAVSFFAYKNGFQSAIMAPTEILAKQHYDTLKNFFESFDIFIVLLVSAMTDRAKKEIKEQIKSGKAQIIIGTQALIQKNVDFYNLGFVVTDEQHRFGVNQRSTLISKGVNPHTLVMSATPIPRTLALIIYGDLDISVLDEMPEGRIPIKTYQVDTSYRERVYKYILKHISENKQAYIICPMINENLSEKTSAVKYFNFLKETYFKNNNIGLLHGKMKQFEKDEVMKSFKDNEISVLVSTTVIEVGVDVPNAVVMLIENAEQFGLSQLHQLRGRVGRGNEQSYCVLVTDSKSEYTKARIDTMTRTTNGFEIAGEDLKLRGPGNFFGLKQHGLPELKIADMTRDIDLVNQTKMLAEKILSEDPNLQKKENQKLNGLIKDLFKESNIYGYN